MLPLNFFIRCMEGVFVSPLVGSVLLIVWVEILDTCKFMVSNGL